MVDTSRARVVVIVKFRSRLSLEELTEKYRERMPEFAKLSGLLQKFYVRGESDGEYAGVYLWDSKESFEEYLASDLRKSIGAAYDVEGPPSVETLTVLEPLRP